MLKLRDIIIATAVALITLFATVSTASCSASQKQEAKSVLEFSKTFCILANSVAEPPAIAMICGIDAVAVPEIERFLSEHRQAGMRELSARPASSASASAPSASAAPTPAPAPASSPPAPSAAPAVSAAPPAASAPAPAKKKKHP